MRRHLAVAKISQPQLQHPIDDANCGEFAAAPLQRKTLVTYNLGPIAVLRYEKQVMHITNEGEMENEIYKTIQVTGTSSTSSDDAVRAGLEKAAKTVRSLRWFRVTDTRGHIVEGKISQWQVTVELNFALD